MELRPFFAKFGYTPKAFLLDRLKFGRPDDIKGLAVLLASDAAEWITGAAIPMDGGNLAMNAGGGLLGPMMERYGAQP